jgi:hypothetical protein
MSVTRSSLTTAPVVVSIHGLQADVLGPADDCMLEAMSQCILSLACLAAFLAIPQTGTDAGNEVHGFLTKVGMTADDLAKLESGGVAARAQTTGNNEIVVHAAVKIRAPRDRVLDYYGQVISYVDGSVTLAFGRFGSPPAIDDVKALAFDAGEVADLRKCKPGKCDIRLGGAAIGALQTSIDWNAAGAADRVNAFVRKAAVDYVAAYQSRGDAALVTYDDRSKPVSLQAQWRALVANSALFPEYAPELKSYLEQYPRGSLPGARDIFYWTRENYGLKPIVSIIHGVVYQPPSRTDRAFVVQKQLYASHYYDGSLALTTLLASVEGGVPSTYLVYVNRSRGDLLKGGFGGLKRNVVQGQARKGAEDTLGSIKSQLEQAAERP